MNDNVKPTIIRIATKFKSAGYELYEVGGYVRDSFRGRNEFYDIDMATNALPNVTKKLLEEFGPVYAIGKDYGTIGVIINDVKYEITTYRSEVYNDGSRKPKVEFGHDIYKDLLRRDFTINAIARDPLDGTIIDPFGGLLDIRDRIVRCVGDDARLDEDPLRMMRAVRFAAQFGYTTKVHIANPEKLDNISKERIHDELSKILLSRRPVFGIRLLCDLGLMEYIIPEIMLMKNMKQGKWHTKDAYSHTLGVLGRGAHMNHGENNLAFRLACLLHDIGKPSTYQETPTGVHFYSHQFVGAGMAEDILERLKFDRDTIETVKRLVYYHMTPIMFHDEFLGVHMSKKSIRKLIRKVGSLNINMLLDLVTCDIRSTKNPRHKFLAVLRRRVVEELEFEPENITSPLDGNELMAILNVGPCRAIGDIKNYLTDLVVEGVIAPDDKARARTLAEMRYEEIIGKD